MCVKRCVAGAQSILEFEEYVANDKENQDDSVTRAAIALLGDLAANLPATGPLFQGKAWVTDLLGQARTPCPASLWVLGKPAANLSAMGVLFQGKAWVTDLLGQARTLALSPDFTFLSHFGHACR